MKSLFSANSDNLSWLIEQIAYANFYEGTVYLMEGEAKADKRGS